MKHNRLDILTNGIIRNNPVLVLVLGTCPTLAVTTQASNAVGMGAAATFVLLGSNICISALRNIISDRVRIPCYIVFIAGFVTLVQMFVKAYAPTLDKALGLYLPLIVVNCIILGRAEMFASKNSVFDSILDAIGMGIGFTLTLFVMASLKDNHISILTMAPGGFFVFGCLIALVNKISKGKAPKKQSFSCAECPSVGACGKFCASGDEE